MSQTSQQTLKQELVDAIRMLERAEYIDHNGHCSARRDANSFFINSGASVRGSLTVEDIVAVDLEGKPIEAQRQTAAESPIHADFRRSQVNAVFHTHPQWSTYLTMTGAADGRLRAGFIAWRHTGMNSPMSVNTKEMGEKMVSIMGNNPVVLPVLMAWCSREYSEASPMPPTSKKMRRQYMAMQIGEPCSVPRSRRLADLLRTQVCSRKHGITISKIV